jgi:hypothetical protein
MVMAFLARHFPCQLSFSVIFLGEVPKNLVDDVLVGGIAAAPFSN